MQTTAPAFSSGQRLQMRLGIWVGVDDEDALGASPFVVPCNESDTVITLKNEILSRCIRMPTSVRITQVLHERDQRPACWLIHKDLGELNDKDAVGHVCRDNDSLLAIFNKKENVPNRAARIGRTPLQTPFPLYKAPQKNPAPATDLSHETWLINVAPRRILRRTLSVKMTNLVTQERDISTFTSMKDLQVRIKAAQGRLGSSTINKMKQNGFFEPFNEQKYNGKEYDDNSKHDSDEDDDEDDDENE